MSETISFSELVVETGVRIGLLRKWHRQGLLPSPLPQAVRERSYALPRATTLARVKELAKARELLMGQ